MTDPSPDAPPRLAHLTCVALGGRVELFLARLDTAAVLVVHLSPEEADSFAADLLRQSAAARGQAQ